LARSCTLSSYPTSPYGSKKPLKRSTRFGALHQSIVIIDVQSDETRIAALGEDHWMTQRVGNNVTGFP